ncbi:hypothetical protein C8R45DRAFT_817330, partial [Mycena sanguinolenta]
FIHRDIKPDQLFLPSGVKLNDFGLATEFHCTHDTSYYEQRLPLLHKHSIDLEDTNGTADGRKTKRMDRQQVELLMGEDGEGGVFTWREKNRRKVGYSYSCDWWSSPGVIMYECLYGYMLPASPHSLLLQIPKILNRKTHLRFPARPQVSHDGVNLMQRLCEPEDRLGSPASASVLRPNSMVVQARRSGFIPPNGSLDGANFIKVAFPNNLKQHGLTLSSKAHPFFRGIDWLNIHCYPAPYHPGLRAPEDTRHFDPDIPAEVRVNSPACLVATTEWYVSAPSTWERRDPLLRHKVHGPEIMDVRKALAFAGLTDKSPRVISYVRADKTFDPEPDSYGRSPPEPSYGQGTIRGRSQLREPQDIGKGRVIAM